MSDSKVVLETETEDSTFFMIVVYDNKQKYFHFVERLHDSPINREQVRDAVQYIEVKKGIKQDGFNYGLGIVPDKSEET